MDECIKIQKFLLKLVQAIQEPCWIIRATYITCRTTWYKWQCSSCMNPFWTQFPLVPKPEGMPRPSATGAAGCLHNDSAIHLVWCKHRQICINTIRDDEMYLLKSHLRAETPKTNTYCACSHAHWGNFIILLQSYYILWDLKRVNLRLWEMDYFLCVSLDDPILLKSQAGSKGV